MMRNRRQVKIDDRRDKSENEGDEIREKIKIHDRKEGKIKDKI